MRAYLIVISVVLCILAMAIPSPGQYCFRGKPECPAFFITETGACEIFSPFSSLLLIAEHGIMFNINDHWALGGVHCISYQQHGDVYRGGFQMRLRRWLNPEWSLDIGSGLLVYAGGTEEWDSAGAHMWEEKLPQVVGSVGVSYQDLIILSIGLDYRRMTEDTDEDGAVWYAGIQGGSYVGASAQGLAVVAGLIILVLHLTVGVGN
jgi:hypothetical protein